MPWQGDLASCPWHRADDHRVWDDKDGYFRRRGIHQQRGSNVTRDPALSGVAKHRRPPVEVAQPGKRVEDQAPRTGRHCAIPCVLQLIRDIVADRATPFRPVEVQDMAAPTGPGPGYDHAEALAAVESRYERISDMFAITLARVVGDVRVRELLGRLRADGWLDWHLVAAVVSVANNYRANALGYLGQGMVDRKAAMELFQTKETADSMVVPLEQFDEHSLAQALKVNAMTVGQAGWGLTAPTQTPNLEATLAVLRERYGYGADDVPHLDLLGGDVFDEHGGFRQMLDVGSADESPTASG